MNGLPLGMMVEIAVSVLLLLTIFYCVILNDKLKRLRADRESLNQLVADLVQSTDMANQAISGLREAAQEADHTLSARLNEAERFGIELANHINSGQTVMERIAKITEAARRGEPAPQAPRLAQKALDRLTILQDRKGQAA